MDFQIFFSINYPSSLPYPPSPSPSESPPVFSGSPLLAPVSSYDSCSAPHHGPFVYPQFLQSLQVIFSHTGYVSHRKIQRKDPQIGGKRLCFSRFPHTIFSSSIHSLVNVMFLLFFAAEWNSIVHMNHIFIVHSSVEDYLGCFHFLAILSTAAMYMVEQVSVE